MSTSNPRAAPRRPPPLRDSNRPPDPLHSNNKAHMSTIANENGSETTVWHYRLTKHHHHDKQQQLKPRTSPQDMLIEFIDALSRNGNHYFLIYQNSDNIAAVARHEISESFDIYNFVSSYMNIPKSSSASLLVRIASNQENLQRAERPIDDLGCTFDGRWTIHPDRF